MMTQTIHKQMLAVLAITVTTIFFLTPSVANSSQAEPVDKTVQYLIGYVAASDVTFIRNSGKYSAKEASGHMQKKYEHFRDEINTPEDFIKLCATRSMLTGKPYLVVNKQGEESRTSEWLTAELEEYRNRQSSGAR